MTITFVGKGPKHICRSSVGWQRFFRELHGVESTWLESVPVTEAFEGQTVWEGVVQVFDLHGHPTATRAYAWSHAIDGSERRRFVAVLHEGPLDSPRKAVQAAIVKDRR